MNWSEIGSQWDEIREKNQMFLAAKSTSRKSGLQECKLI